MFDLIAKSSCLRILASAGAMVFATNSPSFAVSCLEAPAKLDEGAVNGFLSAPTSILTANPDGGILLSNVVRALAASESNTLEQLIGAVSGATDAQKSAIGAGLARAAQACVQSQPDYAAQIQTQVVALDDQQIAAAFETASSDISTAAITGANAGPITPAADATGAGGQTATEAANAGAIGAGTGNGSSSASRASSFSSPSFSADSVVFTNVISPST